MGDPQDVLDVYLRHRAVHPYGIADVVQLWQRSTWWRRDGAVVGVLDLPGAAEPVLYAVTADAHRATLALLGDLAPQLPPAFTATGPVGMCDVLAGRFSAVWGAEYRKMALADGRRLPPADPRVRVLGRADLPALDALFATDSDAGAFFHAGLLDTGLYLGLHVDGELAACAGVHVVEPAHGVAAIGNVVTAPAHRRGGLAQAVTGVLSRRLLAVVDVVGLNVRVRSDAARRLYEGLGFVAVASYEEARLQVPRR